MYCVCLVLILMDCVSTVVSGLMSFCVSTVLSVYLIVWCIIWLAPYLHPVSCLVLEECSVWLWLSCVFVWVLFLVSYRYVCYCHVWSVNCSILFLIPSILSFNMFMLCVLVYVLLLGEGCGELFGGGGSGGQSGEGVWCPCVGCMQGVWVG